MQLQQMLSLPLRIEISPHSLFSLIYQLLSAVFPQAAEIKNAELEGRIGCLQVDIDESQQKQGKMKSELKKFMDILDGKIDELHGFRQGLSKLGVDN